MTSFSIWIGRPAIDTANHSPPLAYPGWMAVRDPVALLGEHSQRRGTGNFPEAYVQTDLRKGEQAWEVTLKDIETGRTATSAVHTSKKRAVKDAATRLLSILDEDTARTKSGEAAEIGVSLNDDALIGDKVLGLCLVLWLRTQGITDKGTVTQYVTQRASNEWLQRTGPKIGVAVSGWQTHRDGSLVEQRVWKLFCANDMDVRKTMEVIRPLFEDEPAMVGKPGEN